MLPPFGFLSALTVRRALARGDFVEGAPLGFHPRVGVAREHGARDVASNAHDHLVACARLGEFRHQRVAVVVPPPDDVCILAYSRLPRRHTRAAGANQPDFVFIGVAFSAGAPRVVTCCHSAPVSL